MGGTSGSSIYYSDVWILRMTDDLWTWIPVEVRNVNDAPPNLWCNPVCKVIRNLQLKYRPLKYLIADRT